MKTVKVCGGHWETTRRSRLWRLRRRCAAAAIAAVVATAVAVTAAVTAAIAAVHRTVCKRVWVPEESTKEVECTTYKQVTEEVPCTYTVCKTREEERTRTVKVCKMVPEERTRTVKVCKTRRKSGPAP